MERPYLSRGSNELPHDFSVMALSIDLTPEQRHEARRMDSLACGLLHVGAIQQDEQAREKLLTMIGDARSVAQMAEIVAMNFGQQVIDAAYAYEARGLGTRSRSKRGTS